jgi:hypothetical protein
MAEVPPSNADSPSASYPLLDSATSTSTNANDLQEKALVIAKSNPSLSAEEYVIPDGGFKAWMTVVGGCVALSLQ